MKKKNLIAVVLICLIGMIAFSFLKVDKTKPIFETDNISSISFYAVPRFDVAVPVPEEHLEDITTWLASFRLDKRIWDQAPGDHVDVEIVYADGTVVRNSLINFNANGRCYTVTHDAPPACYPDLLGR